MSELTAKEKIVLDYIRIHYGDNGEMPSFQEIGSKLGMTRQGARHFVNALIKKGYLKKQEPIKITRKKIDEKP